MPKTKRFKFALGETVVVPALANMEALIEARAEHVDGEDRYGLFYCLRDQRHSAWLKEEELKPKLYLAIPDADQVGSQRMVTPGGQVTVDGYRFGLGRSYGGQPCWVEDLGESVGFGFREMPRLVIAKSHAIKIRPNAVKRHVENEESAKCNPGNEADLAPMSSSPPLVMQHGETGVTL